MPLSAHATSVLSGSINPDVRVEVRAIQILTLHASPDSSEALHAPRLQQDV